MRSSRGHPHSSQRASVEPLAAAPYGVLCAGQARRKTWPEPRCLQSDQHRHLAPSCAQKPRACSDTCPTPPLPKALCLPPPLPWNAPEATHWATPLPTTLLRPVTGGRSASACDTVRAQLSHLEPGWGCVSGGSSNTSERVRKAPRVSQVGQTWLLSCTNGRPHAPHTWHRRIRLERQRFKQC